MERLKQIDCSSIVYHVSNDCYKKYTLSETLENIEKSMSAKAK